MLKRDYTTELKELTVKQVKDGWSTDALAKELSLNEQTPRNWIKAADAGMLAKADGKVVIPEQMEHSRLRAENIRLKRNR